METRHYGTDKRAPIGDDELVSYGVAAAEVGCHKNTVYNWVRDGYLDTRLDGRRKRVRMGDVRLVKNGGSVAEKEALSNG